MFSISFSDFAQHSKLADRNRLVFFVVCVTELMIALSIRNVELFDDYRTLRFAIVLKFQAFCRFLQSL